MTGYQWSLIGLAQGCWLLLAALGVNFAVSYTSMPLLGQSAFIAVGAYGFALLGPGGVGLAVLVAALLAVLLAGGCGLMVGCALARSGSADFALATWVLAWLTPAVIGAFPAALGGSAGLTRPAPPELRSDTLGLQLQLTPKLNLAVAAVSCLAVMLVLTRLSRSPIGLQLASLRDSPSLASSLGISPRYLARLSLAVAATLAGVAGVGLVALLGVVSPSDVSPLLALALYAAGLLAGPGRRWPVVAIVAAIGWLPTLVSQGVGGIGGGGGGLGSVGASSSAVLVAVLLLGSSLLVIPAVRRRGSPELSASLDAPPPGPTIPAPSVPSPADLDVCAPLVRFGSVIALQPLTIRLRRGQVHALIGPNGSGKSTVLALIAGDLPGAELMIDGTALSAGTAVERARLGIVRTPQDFDALPEIVLGRQILLSAFLGLRRPGAVAREVLATPRARLLRERASGRAGEWIRASCLTEVINRSPSELGTGERQLMQLVRAAATGASVLLLDEPAAGLTPSEKARLSGFIRRLAETGRAVLVVEHDMQFVAGVADYVSVLDAGRVVAAGSPSIIRTDPLAVQALFGA